MSNIAIKGATTGTGTFTIESPATNTDRTLTLPDEAGTVLTSASSSTTSVPVFDMRAVNTDQSISAGSFTKVTMNTSVIDTDSMIDLTNNRVTPTVAGYYAVSGMVRINFTTSTEIISIAIRKNGSEVSGVQYQLGSDNLENGQYPIQSTIVQCNGSTDYIELYIYLGDAATINDITTQSQSGTLSGFLMRAT